LLKITLAEITIIFVLIFISSLVIPEITAQNNEPVNVSNTSGESERVQIIVDEKDVYAVWTDKFSENADVFFCKKQ